MKKRLFALVLALTLALAGSLTPTPALAADAWYDQPVALVTALGLMTGTGEGFDPQGTVTRATVFQALYNLEGRPEASSADSDSDYLGTWYERAARWACQTGLTTGTHQGFAGDRPVTRQELATILCRYAAWTVDVTPQADLAQSYADADTVADWALDSLRWASAAGVLTGRAGEEGRLLAPDASVTRAELAQVLCRSIPLLSGTELAGRSVKLNKYGDVYTDITAQALADAGLQPGDILSVRVGQGAPILAPYVTDHSDVALWRDLVMVDEGVACLAVNMGDFATTYGVGSRGDSVFSYEMTELPITLALAQRGGYADALALRGLGDGLVADREEAASDEAYANFRPVTAGAIAPGVLYRSASPIQPEFPRAGCADRLLGAAGVRTIVDMADCRAQAPKYQGFDATEYAKVHSDGGTVYLNMGSDMYTQVGLDDLKNGLDFMAEEEGPYLIHSTWGKDRAGHLLLLLEALMGADEEELTADYLLSYENLYGLERGSAAWRAIAADTVERELARLRELTGAHDLATAAQRHMVDHIGLTQTQVDTLKAKLSAPPAD